MALFSNSNKESKDDKEFAAQKTLKKAISVSSEAIASVISKDMTLTGEISFRGKARIDGSVQGNIKGDYLILSETGNINGDMELDTLICHGRVEGNIKAKLVTIHASSYIHGKLTAQSLTVEPGARLTGEIQASEEETPKKPEPTFPSMTKDKKSGEILDKKA